MTVQVVLTQEAQRQLEGLPEVIRTRMRDIFARLAIWPDVSGAKPLRGALSGQYRIRTGDYRVQFRVEHERIVVVKVGHRDGFYDG